MCGISGIYLNKKIIKKEQKELEAAIKKMNESQKRRGPDDEGVFIDTQNYAEKDAELRGNILRESASGQYQPATIALGHRRLSILDLSKAGHQPMIWQNGSILRTSDVPNIGGNFRTSDVQTLVITYNGEIYNFRELQNNLEKKDYQFKTKTDTEIILALYAEYGEKSFSMLRGMFAFGLYDVGCRKLFLVKDRYGIKPLYYYSDNGKLVFASTVGALKESGLVPKIDNPRAIIGFLLFGSVPLPMTTIKNVRAVPAGHYLVREADGRQKLVQYYNSLEFFNIRTSDVLNIDDNFGMSDVQKIIRQIRNILEESVNLHLISDAPLGVFLSGGLDSSVIAALAAYNIGKSDFPIIDVNFRKSDFQKLTTLSIIFDEKEFSEEYYSDLVAQKIKSDHRKVKITKQDFYDSFDEIFEAMDQPTINGVNTFFIAKAAKQAGLKVVLSGLGADEIFLGYPSFRKAEMLWKIQKLLSIFGHRKTIGLAMTSILNLLGDRYSKLSYFVNNDILSFYLGIRGLFAPQEAAKILDTNLSEVEEFINSIQGTSNVPSINVNIRTSEVQKLHPVDLLSYLELKFYLQNQLLKDTDFMSMRHSIEVRVPFLDHKLVEYVSSLPPELKLNLGASDVPNINVNNRTSDVRNINKPLLVAAVRDLLPQEIFTRPKMGFTFPFEKWMSEAELNDSSVNSQVNEVAHQFRNGNLHWSRYWALAVLEKFRH